jgi:tRNA-modifying protein YgfZ
VNDDLVTGYRHLREDVAAYRLPRDVVSVSGPDAAGYLQGQCSQDLAGLEVGGVLDTLLLAPDGKVEVLARVARTAEDTFHLDTDGGYAGVLVGRLARFKLRSKLEIAPTDWACVALRGPAARALEGLRAAVVAPVEWNGWPGVDLLGPPGSIELPSVPWCGSGAFEAARIESGIPVMGRELTGAEIPAETGTVERTVSFTKGCFTGQELVARIDSRGATVPHRLHGLVLEDATDPALLLAAELYLPDKARAVGRVTSAAECPGLGTTGALAYVHRSVPVPGPVQVAPAGSGREDARPAEVRSLPMV